MKFTTDYIFSWDMSDEGFPIIAVGRLREDGGKLLYDFLGDTHAKSGSVSLLQLLAEYDRKHKPNS